MHLTKQAGGRLRNSFVYTKNEFLASIVPDIDYFSKINNQVITQVIKKFPELNSVEQSPESYWKEQCGNHFYHPDPVQGLEIFGDHCDFGGIASVFTFQADGRGFKYFDYEGGTWKDMVLNEDEFLINMGMEFQCITGMRAICHKVVSNSDEDGSLRRFLSGGILAAASADGIDVTEKDIPYVKITFGIFNNIQGEFLPHMRESSSTSAKAMVSLFPSFDNYLARCLAGEVELKSPDGPYINKK